MKLKPLKCGKEMYKAWRENNNWARGVPRGEAQARSKLSSGGFQARAMSCLCLGKPRSRFRGVGGKGS